MPDSGGRRTVGQAAIDEAREGGFGVRPLLENSTACRKSVPSNKPPALRPSGVVLGFFEVG